MQDENQIPKPWSRRGILRASAALGACALVAGCGKTDAGGTDSFRIGYQKDGVSIIVKQRGTLEKRLASLGVKRVEWAEFPSGPPLLEALSAGGIDFGGTGDTPPIFAQAAGASLVYVAAVPTQGFSSAILVPQASQTKTIGDLKGKKIAFTRGSSAHYFTVAALRSAGLSLGDITPVYLAPADARAAFTRGSIDAWTIWDPFYAAAERDGGARVLTTAAPFVHSASFFLAGRRIAEQKPDVIGAVLDELRTTSRWVANHREDASVLLSRASGIELAILRVALARANFGIETLSKPIVARQQAIADDFARLGIIPKRIVVRDAVWHHAWA